MQVQTSCGFAVPFLAMKADPDDPTKQIPYLEDRDTLGHWAGKQVSSGTLHDYQSRNNARSLDGLPGLRAARKQAGERLWCEDIKARVTAGNRSWQLALVSLLSSLLTVWCMFALGLTTFGSSTLQ